jgi:hypothetical protein
MAGPPLPARTSDGGGCCSVGTAQDQVQFLKKVSAAIYGGYIAVDRQPPDPKAERKAHVTAAVRREMDDRAEFEQHRLWAWADYFHESHDYSSSAESPEGARLKACWDAGRSAFVMPEGEDVVPAGWPPGVAPEAYVRKQVEGAAQPVGESAEDEPEPEEPARTEMHEMLEAATKPARPKRRANDAT